MGSASMRKWMRRADAAYARDRGTPMLWPYQSEPRRARALYLRREHRRKRALDRFHGLIARVIENRSAQIEANVRTNNALLARALGPGSNAFWGRVRA